MIGRLVGSRYQIVRLLGQGGMGAVYEAVHTGTGRRVALKVILGGPFAEPMLVARFQREAKAAGQIDTQHVVRILDSGTDEAGGFAFLAMEVLSGEDLDHVFARLGPLPVDLALRIVAQGCLGLVKAHEVGVVHRDIKPANLYLASREAGELLVKVLDFGIAKVKMDHLGQGGQESLTRTGSILGSPAYMSPEQAQGLKTIDHRTDLWSMGVVLYEALAGQTPLHDITSLAQILVELCVKPPRPLREVAPWVAPEVAEVVHRCLMRAPNDRFQSASELFDALRPLLPNGWSLQASMVVSGSRTVPESAQPALPRAASTSGPHGTVVLDEASVDAARAVVPAQAFAPSADPQLAATAVAEPPPARRSRAAPIVAGVTLLVLGGGIWAGLHVSASGAKVRPSAEPSATAAPSQVPPPGSSPPSGVIPASPSASAASPVVVAEAPKRTVRVVILPSTALVEVDGVRVVSRRGVVELTGPLGTSRRVRVHAGAREVTTEVRIGADGAEPPAIDLGR